MVRLEFSDGSWLTNVANPAEVLPPPAPISRHSYASPLPQTPRLAAHPDSGWAFDGTGSKFVHADERLLDS